MTTELKPLLTEIADAIRNKKGTSENINAQDFATEIESIETGGGEDLWKILINNRGTNWQYLFAYNKTIVNPTDWFAGVTTQPTSLQYAFRDCTSLVQMPYIDTSKCTNFTYVCYRCTALATFPNWDFSAATTLDYAFDGCSFTNVPDLDCTTITNLGYAFYDCRKLTKLKLMNTQNVTRFAACISGCWELKLIDIDTLDGVTSSSYGFGWYNNYSLQHVIVRRMTKIPVYYQYSFDSPTGTSGSYRFKNLYNATYNPEWRVGEMYVPDDYVDQLKTATGWSNWAHVYKPLSTMPESFDPTIPYINRIERFSSSSRVWEMTKINDIKYYYSYQPTSFSKIIFTVPENATDNTLTFEITVNGTDAQLPQTVSFSKLDTTISGIDDEDNMHYFAKNPAAGTYTVVYNNLTPGEHFIYIGAKVRESGSTAYNYFKFRRIGGFN